MQTRSIEIPAGTAARGFFRIPFNNVPALSGRMVAVNKSGSQTTFSNSGRFYETGVEFVLPASYTTASNLPATVHLYVTEAGQPEKKIAQITVTAKVTDSDVLSNAEVAEVSNIVAQAVPAKPVRRVTMSLGAPRTQNAAGALANWAERIPVKVPTKTTRWRIKIANRALLPTAAPVALTQQFSVGDIYLGAPGALSTDGRPTGAWSSAPTKIIDGALMKNDGTDWVSDWITDPNLQLGPSDIKQIGFTFSGTNNGNGSATTSSHYGFRSTAAGINAINHTQLNRNNFVGNTLAFDKRIEYEFEGTNPVGLLIGASGDEGYHLGVALDGAGGYEVLPNYETWAGVHGQRTKTHWVNAAITGATQTPFLSKDYSTFTRFDLTTTVPDFAVVSLGGNSVLAGTALTTIKPEVVTVVNQVRALGIKKIYLSTIVPVALASGSANEILRNGYNDWIRTNPLLADGVIDVDVILRDPANKLVQIPGFVATDNIHPNHAGYQRWGMSVPSLA